jgi:hypothetical protein
MSARLATPGVAEGVVAAAELAVRSTRREIIDFLECRSDGAARLLAIYGDLAEETLPPRLAALVERWRAVMR